MAMPSIDDDGQTTLLIFTEHITKPLESEYVCPSQGSWIHTSSYSTYIGCWVKVSFLMGYTSQSIFVLRLFI